MLSGIMRGRNSRDRVGDVLGFVVYLRIEAVVEVGWEL
jgi:hypothetical protein